MDTDSKLIKKMRQGDDTAVDLFVQKYYSDILRYCSYHCPDRGYAEDLTQDTFVRFFENFGEYSHVGKAKNYLYVIAGNLCRNYYRGLREIPDSQSIESETGRGSENGTEIVEQIAIQQALDALPDELREVIILYYYQDLKQKEIAEILGIGVPLVKYRLKRAKQELESCLGWEA